MTADFVAIILSYKGCKQDITYHEDWVNKNCVEMYKFNRKYLYIITSFHLGT
jgi:hypothetical protein